MEESTVVLANMCFYIALFVFCWKKYKFRNLSTFLALLYMFSAISSYLLFNFPLYEASFTAVGESTLEASIYLFVLNTIFITTFSNAKLDDLQFLTFYNERLILKWQKILVVCLAVYVLACLPSSIISFSGSNDLANLRNEQYGDNTGASSFVVINLISRIFGGMTIFLLCLPCINYFLLGKFTRWDKYSLVVYALFKINTILSAVSRGTIIFSFIEVFIILFFFYPYIDKKVMKVIKKWGTISILGVYLVFSAITFARFEKQGDSVVATFATLRYAGEAQLNFMNLVYPDLKEPWYGYRQLTLFRRVLGLPYDDGTTRNGSTVYDDYISSEYHWPHPVYVFYSAAGSWVMNMGFFLPFIIAVWINYKFKKNYACRRKASVILLVLTIIVSAYYAKGIFIPDYQNESGNMMVILLIFAYLCLKKNGGTIAVIDRVYTK